MVVILFPIDYAYNFKRNVYEVICRKHHVLELQILVHSFQTCFRSPVSSDCDYYFKDNTYVLSFNSSLSQRQI